MGKVNWTCSREGALEQRVGWGKLLNYKKKTERIRSFNLEKNYYSYMLTQEFSSIKIEIA